MSTIKTKFIDVKLDQETFSPTSIKAIKEIYASKFQISKYDVKELDHRLCVKALIKLKDEEVV
jgi:hypothetical protein